MKWIAHFDDGKVFRQFGENEIKFKEVQDYMHKLIMFNLIDENGKVYSVDLTRNCISINEDIVSTELMGVDASLIYYKKCYLNLGDNFVKEIYFIGLDSGDKQIKIEINPYTNKIIKHIN